MNTIDTLFNSPLTHRLGWTLMHFLWQGAMVGAVYAVLKYLLSWKSPAVRYHLAMSTLAVMSALPVITFMYISYTAMGAAANEALPALINVSVSGLTRIVSPPLSPLGYLKVWLQPMVPWAVPLWLLGVLVMALRVWRGWRHAYHLRQTATFIPLPQWNVMVESLRTLLGIRKLVRLAVSVSVMVPSVIGWLKPIILIPPSAIAGLTPLQMELILAHELAHIRRQDYLWNLLQVAVETLLFYHPVVRWVSHQARLEREQCCDDIVVGLHGNAIDYARALTELESLRHPPRVALLLGANGGQVLDRIHRLLGLPTPNVAVSWLPLLLAAGLLFTGGLMQFAQQKTPLQSVLTTKYTMVGTVAQATSTSTKAPSATMMPTRITPTALTPPTLKPVRIPSELPHPALSGIPVLATPMPPSVTAPVTVTAAAHATPATNQTGGDVIAYYSPIYPPSALEREVEGSATVKFTLTAEGGVTNLRIIHVTGSRLFGQAAMDAIRQWKFTPVTVAGIPVVQPMTEEFIFHIQDRAANHRPCEILTGYHVCAN